MSTSTERQPKPEVQKANSGHPRTPMAMAPVVYTLWRQFPGDANEIAEAWRVIVQLRHEPVCPILSRRNMPTLDRTRYAPASGVAKGAYVLADTPGAKPDLLLIGTGSEVSVEQASVFGWDRYARRRRRKHTFGASAPLKELQKKFGFTPDAVAAAKDELAKAQ
jgi:transketolase